MDKNNGEVKSGKSKVLDEKDKLILLQLKQNPEGLRVSTLHKLTNIPSRTIYNRLEAFAEDHLILNLYPVWKPNNGQSDFWQSLSQSSNIFELHNLGYVIKLINKPDWWNKRKSNLMRLKEWQFSNHNFGKNNSNPYQQIINEDFVIQTYPESIIIIHRKRFYSNDPFQIIQEGMIKTLEIIKFLEQKFRFNFFPSGIPCIELRDNDFNRIKDHLAEKCKKEGNKFLVETPVGNCWVDKSEPFGKEANTPDIQETLEKHTKDLIINKPLLNSEIQELVGKLGQSQLNQTQQLEQFAIALNRHIPAYEGMASYVKELKEDQNKNNQLLIKALNKLNERLDKAGL